MELNQFKAKKSKNKKNKNKKNPQKQKQNMKRIWKITPINQTVKKLIFFLYKTTHLSEAYGFINVTINNPKIIYLLLHRSMRWNINLSGFTFLDRMLKYTLVFSNGRRQINYHNDYCSGEAMRRSKGDKLSTTDSRIVILYSLTSFSLFFNIKQFFSHSPR